MELLLLSGVPLNFYLARYVMSRLKRPKYNILNLGVSILKFKQ